MFFIRGEIKHTDPPARGHRVGSAWSLPTEQESEEEEAKRDGPGPALNKALEMNFY